MNYIYETITPEQRTQLGAIRAHAEKLLDLSPHFKYFTLHGVQHFSNLFAIVDILHEAGLTLKQDEAFLLGCCLCMHDVGMVIPLSSTEGHDLFSGMPQPADPSDITKQIRTVHHELINTYISENFNFLTALGLSASDCAIIRDISRSHRVVDLNSQQGFPKSLGALLRIVDELDIFPSRAPGAILQSHYKEMDTTSCWHWYKHNITQDWRIGHNVEIIPGATPKATFNIAVHPHSTASIPYWLRQVRRPLAKVFYDEGASRIVLEQWGINLIINESQDLSTPVDRGEIWQLIEQKALSANRKVILVIDDEVRKMHDLFLNLMNDFHIIFSQNAMDALEKLAALPINLAIVDLQIGSGFQWDATETKDYKMTGALICKAIKEKYPKTKVGILTGSRHDLTDLKSIPDLAFLLKKPVDPEEFELEIKNALS